VVFGDESFLRRRTECVPCGELRYHHVQRPLSGGRTVGDGLVCSLFRARPERSLPVLDAVGREIEEHVLRQIAGESPLVLVAGQPFAVDVDHLQLPERSIERDEVASAAKVLRDRGHGGSGQGAGVRNHQQIERRGSQPVRIAERVAADLGHLVAGVCESHRQCLGKRRLIVRQA